MDRDAIARRLKEARTSADFKSAREAADSLGVAYPTYAAHENGSRGIEVEAAIHYARRFRVSLDWLLTEKGKGPGDNGSASTPESRLRSALLEFGVDAADLGRAVLVIRGFVDDFVEQSEQDPRRDQSAPANRRHAAAPSR
ncbi:MAG: helix-turn-helix domain-containing protein [Rhizobiaceae bacterium]|nr:helix-turn-helix domain-containing protein [Rhizobiaceae bacterium]